MAGKGVRLLLLCEDDEHERFARHAFLKLGYSHHELRALTSPAGRGAAENWVRKRYADEVKAHRSRVKFQRIGLTVLIDADTATVAHRHKQLDDALAESRQDKRAANEQIVLWVPRRNIETWVAALLGQAVNEDEDYKNAVRNVDYREPARRFVELYQDAANRPPNLLPSLATAFEELDRIK